MVTALITGASGGIGEAFARRLAADGWDLFLVARRSEILSALCSELEKNHSIQAFAFAADLSENDGPHRVFDETKSLGIEIDLLINNAGFGSMGDLTDLDPGREAEMIRLNAAAVTELTARFLPQMRQRRSGTIINVSSTAGAQPIPFMATYAATKAFVTSFTEAVAEESRPFGIHVYALCPGSTKTNFFEAGNIGTRFAFKGQHSADEVVDYALSRIGSAKLKMVPGIINRLVAWVAGLLPERWVVRIVARKLRAVYQKEA